jgi:aminopeptidase N
MGQYCSRSKNAKEALLFHKNIVQTPLLNNYDVKFYFLDLNAENNSIYISGNVTIQASVVNNQLDTFAFELLDELDIDSVFVMGLTQTFHRSNNEVFVSLDNPLTFGESFTCQVFYHGMPPTGGFFSGISTKYDTTWNKNVTWTLSEPFNARQWWPTKQVLEDKADSSWVFITTSAENKAGSNGLLTNVVDLPNNKKRFEWKSKYPIDYYLISFAVAEYQEYNIYAKPADLLCDSLLIQNYIYDAPGCLSYYKQGIDNTVSFLELFSELFSQYPFYEEKYGHCMAGIGGGMEHQTMTTLGRFDFGLVAHELGHMWFGDNVTCSNWSDIWINEGFATYAEYLAVEKIGGEPWPTIWRKNVHNFIMSEPGGSIYVPEEEVAYDNVERIFDSRLTYWKGAVILHMIRFNLQNDTLFFDVLKNFQQKFADSLASAQDFINVLNESSGHDFSEFFDQWYYGEGYPVYSINFKQIDGSLELESVQTTSMPEITPFFKMKLPVKIFFNDGSDSIVILNQESNTMTFTIPIYKAIDSIQVDPDRWVLKKVESIIGINENEFSNYFTILPNPANDHIIVRSETETINKVAIHDLYGNIVKSFDRMQPIYRIDVSGFSPGLYLIKVEIGEKSYTRKFIKR